MHSLSLYWGIPTIAGSAAVPARTQRVYTVPGRIPSLNVSITDLSVLKHFFVRSLRQNLCAAIFFVWQY